MIKPRREAFHKLRILKYAEEIGSVVKTCRYFGVGRASFYRWRKFLESFAEENAEVREALAIQQAYLSIFFGGKAPKTRERVQRPKSKERSR